MDFRTCITIPPSNLRITHRNRILALGSCFAESMTEMLTQMRYNIVCNPFGALYNPLSIVRHIKRVASNSYYSDRDIIEWQGRWFSTDAHTLLESSNMATAIEQMNKALERRTTLSKVPTLSLSLSALILSMSEVARWLQIVISYLQGSLLDDEQASKRWFRH